MFGQQKGVTSLLTTKNSRKPFFFKKKRTIVTSLLATRLLRAFRFYFLFFCCLVTMATLDGQSTFATTLRSVLAICLFSTNELRQSLKGAPGGGARSCRFARRRHKRACDATSHRAAQKRSTLVVKTWPTTPTTPTFGRRTSGTRRRPLPNDALRRCLGRALAAVVVVARGWGAATPARCLITLDRRAPRGPSIPRPSLDSASRNAP